MLISVFVSFIDGAILIREVFGSIGEIMLQLYHVVRRFASSVIAALQFVLKVGFVASIVMAFLGSSLYTFVIDRARRFLAARNVGGYQRVRINVPLAPISPDVTMRYTVNDAPDRVRTWFNQQGVPQRLGVLVGPDAVPEEEENVVNDEEDEMAWVDRIRDSYYEVDFSGEEDISSDDGEPWIF
ncbi:hypothetical protein BZA05DRAFT_442081 [Tricharina praecox]|uniref:uncharacterized protein n=1 Tax=Tricharina praecox TaxID=43433 RepID=UPI00221E8440|nr:uncharacterized protein BZA05DRAFT_442081 [Tricharina praecox]KAI5856386.1 hypothetical protein BZA05DRAFT_442081 [Tricharina praecox]